MIESRKLAMFSEKKINPCLFNRDRWLPRLLLVENGQTDSTGRIYVGMEKWRTEFACQTSSYHDEV